MTGYYTGLEHPSLTEPYSFPTGRQMRYDVSGSIPMKKAAAGIMFFVIIIPAISAENTFDCSWNAGSLGIGMSLSHSDVALELTVSIINITFEHTDLNMGIEFTPIQYRYVYGSRDGFEGVTEKSQFSLINTAVYWDLIENRRVLLGPFASIHYMYVDTSTGINMNEYISGGGLRFAYKLKDSRFPENYNAQIIGSEIGYRSITGKNNVYFSVNIDVILALIAAGSGRQLNRGYN